MKTRAPWLLSMALLPWTLTVAGAADPLPAAPAATPEGTVRLLAIGNSFSQNALSFLSQIASSQGKKLVLGHASIGGCTLEKHWSLAQRNAADPSDPAGRPYTLSTADGNRKASLKEMLAAQPWDVVTLQQQSWASPDLETYRPHAQLLADFVRTNAPTAKLWIHETWAYRTDHPLLKKKPMTQDEMYTKLQAAYATIAKEIHAANILPVGTAFQNARRDPRWLPEIAEGIDSHTLVHPNLPQEPHALCTGWSWNAKQQPPALSYDGKHATTAGKYLAGLVWYEALFAPLQGDSYLPKGLSPEDAAILRDIAHKTLESHRTPQ